MHIYDELKVPTFINAYRPLTRLGGATLPDVVIAAMQQASQKNISLQTLQRQVGDAIARLTNNEAAYVSCGAFSGIILAVAACMAGTDSVLSDRLPDTTGMKNEVIMQTCDRGYKSDVAIRCAGATILNVGDKDGASEHDFRNAITRKTAAIFIHDTPTRKLRLEQVASIARERQVPVLFDAAFSVPPKRKLWEFTRDGGADAVFVSGGKGLRGPQSTGLILGKAWLVKACAFQGAPNDRIGRGMKVGKEELAGIYAAVKLLMSQDDETARARRKQQLEHIASLIDGIQGLHFVKMNSTSGTIALDPTVYQFSCARVSSELLNASPSVYLEALNDRLIVSVECLEEGEEIVVGNQLRKFFRQLTSSEIVGSSSGHDGHGLSCNVVRAMLAD